MIIGLLTPADTGCASNAGAHMITAGIRWLLRQALHDAHFVNIEMLHEAADQWRAIDYCAALVVCGNPRFSLSADDAWWETGICERIGEARRRGLRVLDAWAGACYPYEAPMPGMPAMSEALEALPRVQQALRTLRALDGVITRDTLAQSLCVRAGINAVQLPCSSYWAPNELGVLPRQIRARSAVVLLALEGHDWAPDALYALWTKLAAEDGAPPMMLATTLRDAEWAYSVSLPNVRLVTEPRSLLQIYAGLRRVVSLRVHASVPAAALGAEVATLSIDSRAQLLEPFDLPAQPFTDLRDDIPLRFSVGRGRDAAPAVHHLRSLLTC